MSQKFANGQAEEIDHLKSPTTTTIIATRIVVPTISVPSSKLAFEDVWLIKSFKLVIKQNRLMNHRFSVLELFALGKISNQLATSAHSGTYNYHF